MNKYTQEQIDQALDMKADGKTLKEIAKKTKINRSSIVYYVRRNKTSDTITTTDVNKFEFIDNLTITADAKITLLRWLRL